MLRAATSKTMAFLIINSVAQTIGNAMGAQVSPLVTVSAAVTQSAVSNFLANLIEIPIRIGYAGYRLVRFSFGIIQGRLMSNSPIITQVREMTTTILGIVQKVLGKSQATIQKAKDDGCFSYNPFVSRVYAANGDGPTCHPIFRAPVKVLKEYVSKGSFEKDKRRVFRVLGYDILFKLGVYFLTEPIATPDPTEHTQWGRFDLACVDNDVREVDYTDSSYDQLVKTCSSGCYEGKCKGTIGGECNFVSPEANNLFIGEKGELLICNTKGSLEKVSGFNERVTVVSSNNQLKYALLMQLSRLPKDFLDHDVTMVILPAESLSPSDNSWQSAMTKLIWSLISNTSDPSSASQLRGAVVPWDYATHKTIYLTEPLIVAYDKQYALHEVMHAYAYDQDLVSPLVPFSYVINSFNYIISTNTNPYASGTPTEYGDLVECDKNTQTTPRFVSERGAESCEENFAEAGRLYIDDPCYLQKNFENQYGYFNTEVFQEREYLPPGGCGN